MVLALKIRGNLTLTSMTVGISWTAAGAPMPAGTQSLAAMHGIPMTPCSCAGNSAGDFSGGGVMGPAGLARGGGGGGGFGGTAGCGSCHSMHRIDLNTAPVVQTRFLKLIVPCCALHPG